MKKILNFIFIIILTSSVISCDKLLKDPQAEGSGWGDIIINKSNIVIDNNLDITVDTLNFDKAILTIKDIKDEKEGTIGQPIENVTSGIKTVNIKIPNLDGSINYIGIGNIVVEANNLVSTTIILNKSQSNTNAWKFIFNPANYGVSVANEVHLVGNLPNADWNPSNLSFPLVKQTDGTWIGYFDINSGTEFKFMYDSSSWDDGHDIGDNGSNFIVANTPRIIENVLAWKFTFNPANYGVSVANEVHLVGNLPNADWNPSNISFPLVKQTDGTWVGYFDINSGTEFKFMYDSFSWDDGHDIGDNGSNFIVAETPGILTQNF